jgi:hypothetical protein
LPIGAGGRAAEPDAPKIGERRLLDLIYSAAYAAYEDLRRLASRVSAGSTARAAGL